MLVPGLEGRLPAKTEDLRRSVVIVIEVAGPIITNLMIVERHEEGMGGVGGLQVGVGFVLGIAPTIIVERRDQRARMLAGRRRRVRAIFINVVAVVEDELQLLVRHVAVSGVISGLVVLAAGDPEAQLLRRGIASWKRAGAADAAALAAGFEAIEIGPVGLEPRYFDVDRMRKLGRAPPPRPWRRWRSKPSSPATSQAAGIGLERHAAVRARAVPGRGGSR